MELRIERVVDEAGARVWHDVVEHQTPLDHGGMESEPLADLLGMLPDGTPSERMEWWLALEGDRAVGVAGASFPLKENLHLANLSIVVAQAARRHGVAGELADVVLQRLRDDGRTTAVGFIGAPVGTTAPGEAFASGLGAKPALATIRRELVLADVDDAALAAVLEDQVLPMAVGYDVVQWIDVVPDHLVDGAAALLPHVFMDSPRGDLDFEDEVWDGPRYRDYERDVAARGRRLVATGAVERTSGRLVAYTDITVPTTRPSSAGQWGTIVDEEHRGHRLGLLVKLENLAQLRRSFEKVVRVNTWNAADNQHMIRVNELIGFRVAEHYQAWQLAL